MMKKEKSFRDMSRTAIAKSVSVVGYARVRPFLAKELELDDATEPIVDLYVDVALIADPRKPSDTPPDAFSLDRIFNDLGKPPCEEAQSALFEEVMRPLLNAAVTGVNGCVMAYGAASTGKTFTCFGSNECPGIARRTGPALFSQLEVPEKGVRTTVSCSMFELYNEKVNDLLWAPDDKGRVECRIRCSQSGVLVEGLRSIKVTTAAELQDLIVKGEMSRAAHSQNSSKTHAVFLLDIVRSDAPRSVIRKSQITVLDLAGTERTKRAGFMTVSSKNVLEQKNVTVSLMALRRVVDVLTEQKKGSGTAPFRDSVLTTFLSDTIGGNCRCSLIATISAHPEHYDDTVATLEFAEKMKHVQCRPVVNEQHCEAAVADLEAQMRALKAQMMQAASEPSADFGRSASMELSQLEKELSVAMAVKQVKEQRSMAMKEQVERRSNELAEVERQVEGKMNILREVQATEREVEHLLARRSETAQQIDEHVLLNEKRNLQIQYARQRGKSMLRRIEQVEKKLRESKNDEVTAKQRGIADVLRLATELGRQREEIQFYRKTVQSLMLKEKELHKRARSVRDEVKGLGVANNDISLECELLLTELERLTTMLDSETELKMCAVTAVTRATEAVRCDIVAMRGELELCSTRVSELQGAVRTSVAAAPQEKSLRDKIAAEEQLLALLDSEATCLLAEEAQLQQFVELRHVRLGDLETDKAAVLRKQAELSDAASQGERQAVANLSDESRELEHLLLTAEGELEEATTSLAAATKKLSTLQKAHIQLERYVTDRLFNPHAFSDLSRK
jgi:hypothetical protein